MSTGSELSPTMRDYLAEVYCLSEVRAEERGYVSTSALAELLDVSAPAVNRMVTKLRDLGLLHHEPYQGITLTTHGIKEALVRLRYQRIAASFLVNVMGFGWHEIYEEAHRMSSGLSEAVAARMLEMSGNPVFDPYGEPIPEADGTIKDMNDTPLSEIEAAACVTITRVRTREPDRLEYLAALELTPGTWLQVLHKAPFNGPMQLKLDGEYRIIGHNLAELVRVQLDES